uniref:CYRIA/CYRIB Rac1 binding domain-containing protein n=1 Tax=Eptatretus burgeri TaxID=7764 RepID=A0A8C4WWL2_EPTBU
MGNLLKVLNSPDLEQGPNFFLDFENAHPSENEREVWDTVAQVLSHAEQVLAALQAYQGAGPQIREAISHSSDEEQQHKAWEAVCPLVSKLKSFYEFSLQLESALHCLLTVLTAPPLSPTQHLEREQALAKQFAEILHFTLQFDETPLFVFTNGVHFLKLNCVTVMPMNEDGVWVTGFRGWQWCCPGTYSRYNHFSSPLCREYRGRFASPETESFCLRVMVGVIILYDHVHPVGAFARTSKIDMKGCIRVLKEQPAANVEALMNALRYTTRHINDESSCKQIRSMLQ